MQTYGFSWNLWGAHMSEGLPDIVAYWPIMGLDSPDAQWKNVSTRHFSDDKRRTGLQSGSGPYYHHRSVYQLSSVGKVGTSKRYYLVAGSVFCETKLASPPNCSWFNKTGNNVIQCTIEPYGIGQLGITLYEYACPVLDRYNTVVTYRMYQTNVDVSYTSVAHTEGVVMGYYKQFSPQLQRATWRTMYRSLHHADIITGSPIQLDYTQMRDAQPAPIDFGHDWENISLIGYPIGRSSNFAQRAYEIAAADIPVADVNAIANTMESASAIRSVILSDITALLPAGRTWGKAVAGSWLAYRYSICTSKFDVDSYKDLLRRLKVMSKHQYIKCRSIVQDPDTGDIYRVTLKFKVTGFDNSFTSKLDRLGFRLSLVNAWDVVPYSFIIDWFTNIDDILSVLDQKCQSAQLDPVESWASRESADHTTYIRWRVTWMPTFPLLQIKEASQKTFFMRVADAIALLACR